MHITYPKPKPPMILLAKTILSPLHKITRPKNAQIAYNNYTVELLVKLWAVEIYIAYNNYTVEPLAKLWQLKFMQIRMYVLLY